MPPSTPRSQARASVPGRARVRVPCSTSNLGPGFDLLGLALSMHLDVELERREGLESGAHSFERTGEFADELSGLRNERVVEAFELAASRLELAGSGEGLEGALGRLFAIVAGEQLGGQWRRLKACANPACNAAFYDASSNRSGRWCSMRRCGVRLHSRRHQRQLRRQSAGS